MKKKLSFLLLALVTVAAFAVQTARRAAAASEAESATVKTWEQASSIAVNDIVLFTNISAKKELKTIELFKTSYVGSTEDYTENIPAGVYPLTVVAGSSEGTIAFKTSDNKYLAWAAGNTLSAADAVDANSSWTVTFEGTTPTIVNGADASRKLQYNTGNPRFATYTSSQTAIDIWKQVEKEAPAVEAPVITVADNFEETTPVTITCATDGATIYYTLDGKEPTAESTQYTESFNLDKTAVIKAIAIKGENKSSITEKKTYCSKIADLATLNDYPNAYSFTFTGEALVVAKPTANYVYVKDSKASSLIYNKEEKLTAAAEVGKTIAANWTGKVSFYNKLFEAVPDAALVMKEGDAAKVTYPTVDASYITADHINEVVTLKGVTYTKGSGKNLTFAKGEATVAGYNQFGLTIADPVEGKTYDVIGAIGRFNDNIQFQPIEIAAVDDIVIAPESGDISAALATAIEGKNVGNITINLTKDVAYTISAPIVVPNSLVINGNGATIDASSLTGDNAIIKLPAGVTDYTTFGEILFNDVNMKVATRLVYGNKSKFWVEKIGVENSTISVDGTFKKSIFDFNGGGNVKLLSVNKSTIYANPKIGQNGGFFSSQSSQKPTEFGASETQTFQITNSTLYNITNGNNMVTLRENNKPYLNFIFKNNVIVDCGKNKEFFKGFGGGNACANSTWDVDGNLINFNGADTNANEVCGKGAEDVKNSIAGIVTFENAVEGKFDGELGVATVPTTETVTVGDPRWKLTAKQVPFDIEISPASGDIAEALATASAGKLVKDIKINLTKDVTYTISAPIVAPNSLVINGNGATIDASAVSGPLFQHGATAVAAPRRAPVTPVEGYTYIDDVSIENVTITGIKGSIYWDGNQKTCIEDFTIDNAVLVLATESSSLKDNTIISFQGGCAKDFTVKKSTIYGNGVAKYFNKANNGADFVKAGYEEAKLTYENNTFYNVLNSDGQWGNNLRYNNNKAKVVAAINNNIWSDCGNGQIMRRLLNTNFKDLNAASTMANNIFNANGAVVDQANYGNGSDLAAIVTFPEVADAKFNAELGVAVVPETPIAVGDPRWTVTAKQVPFDIEISPAEGDIAAALATASAGKLVKDIKINLTKDVTYTISAPIVAPNSLVINGNGATIDASAVSGPLFQHGATAVAAPRRAPVTPVEGYTYIDDVSIENVTITGIKGSIYWDGNQKTCIEDFTIDNAVLVLATESSSLKDNTIISFQGGCAKDFTVKKSTIYGNGVAKYFNKANNGADFVKAGYEEAKLTYENNTFYNVLNSDGQWGNNLRYNNNKAKVVAAINNNIWSDCGNGQIMRRLLNTNFKDLNAASTMANNIFNANGAVVDQANYGNGSDLAGIVTFEDAAAGKFGGNVELPYGVEKPAAQPGDARWTLTYTNAPQKFTVNLAAVENGTVSTDATGALAEGTLVTITATPNEGYELGAITVTGVYSNLAVVVTDGKFTMPADDVTVTVTFKVATGIQNVSVENNSLENATIYDLNGRRVENPTKKGIYIVNGKKVVIK